eukprot:symbB.v1.2.021047.t1/scaffold1797.1/size100932/14
MKRYYCKDEGLRKRMRCCGCNFKIIMVSWLQNGDRRYSSKRGFVKKRQRWKSCRQRFFGISPGSKSRRKSYLPCGRTPCGGDCLLDVNPRG